jgi:adenylate kinase family enzyme
MLRARHDDTEAGIKKRFEEYENNVMPALSLLKEKGYKINEVSGEISRAAHSIMWC